MTNTATNLEIYNMWGRMKYGDSWAEIVAQPPPLRGGAPQGRPRTPWGNGGPGSRKA